MWYTHGMRRAWNTGHTKGTHASVRKISETMRAKKIDNFKAWRQIQKKEGLLKCTYEPFARSKDLAELIGVILGDGHIGVFPRTESLRIVGNSNNPGFIARYARIVESVFGKRPHIAKRKDSNAINITIYEKHISSRLGIPSGARGHRRLLVPKWINVDDEYCISYLRGLYEAEGSYSVHQATYTHKFIFANTNRSLLTNVSGLLSRFGYHPSVSTTRVQISRKEEVQKLINLVEFRRY
jgi:intein-encoded DNA endonuclease-like protein